METFARNDAFEARFGHGLIIGKFMPLTEGHCHLIREARERCEELTILVCSLAAEPIAGHLRWNWVRETFPEARVLHVTDEVPSYPHEHPDFWRIWRSLIERHWPHCDEGGAVLFSSEEYGDRLAQELNVVHICVDKDRATIPISATRLRAEPFRHWQFIPPAVRSHYARRILIYGPESTGKTTLAKALAEHYNTVWVPEWARGFFDAKGGIDYEDISVIAAGQQETEEVAARTANRLLFCDTDAVTTTIYSRHYFGRCPLWVQKLADERRYDLYLMTDIDIAWEADPQRDLGERREEFFEIFRRELVSRRLPFVTIRGQGEERTKCAIAAVDAYLTTLS